MNIVINTLALNKIKAGMGNYIVNLVKEVIAADKKKENNYFIYISKRNKEYFTDAIIRIPGNVFFILVPNIFLNYLGKIFFEQCIIPLDLVRRKIDVYHSPGFSLPLLSLSNKTKNIVTIADMTFFSHSQHHMTLKNIYFRWIIPQSIKKADGVIAISESTKKDILSYIPSSQEKIRTIYLGVDQSFKKERNKSMQNIEEENNVLKKYGIEKDYILYVGVLEPRKNIKGLLHAFAEVKKKNKKICLVIVGKKGWKYESIFALVKELRLEADIIFTNYVIDKDLYFLYARAICFCYPSFYEGFGLPVLEAMTVGCPVITSDNSSLKEIAKDACILIDPYNKNEITCALKDIINDKKLRNELKIKGKKRANDFSWQKMAQETLCLYKEF